VSALRQVFARAAAPPRSPRRRSAALPPALPPAARRARPGAIVRHPVLGFGVVLAVTRAGGDMPRMALARFADQTAWMPRAQLTTYAYLPTPSELCSGSLVFVVTPAGEVLYLHRISGPRVIASLHDQPRPGACMTQLDIYRVMLLTALGRRRARQGLAAFRAMVAAVFRNHPPPILAKP
jgi:hypothetical protein